MNDVPQTPLPDSMLPVTQSDLDKAGYPVNAPMAPGLAVFFNDALYLRCRSLAVIMAEGQGSTPKHLIGKPQACFAVISRSITWNLDPFAVAMATYMTPGGQLGFEGKLVQAILEASNKLDGGVKFEHRGDWSKVKGKFKLQKSSKGDGHYPVPTWTREGPGNDAAGLSVIVSAKLKGETEPRTLNVDLDSAWPLNSPLWATAPERQICYLAVRAFANHAMPSVLMGLPFDYEEPLSALTDVTPPRPKKAAAGEFDRKEAAATEAKFQEAKTNGKATEPEKTQQTTEPETVTETATVQDKLEAEVVKGEPAKPAEPAKTAEPPKTEVVSSNEVAKSNMPPDDSTAEQAATDEHALWFRDQIAEIDKCATVQELIDLRDLVVQNVLNEGQAVEFRKLGAVRVGAILNGELAKCKYVKDVTDLRGKYTAVLGADMGTYFNKMCDDRQRSILEATKRTKK